VALHLASLQCIQYCSGRPVSRANRQARPSTTQPCKPLRKSPTRDIPIASDSILPAVQSVPAVIGPAVGSCQAQLFPQEPPQLASASPWLFWAPPPFVDLHPPSRGSRPASTSPTHRSSTEPHPTLRGCPRPSKMPGEFLQLLPVRPTCPLSHSCRLVTSAAPNQLDHVTCIPAQAKRLHAARQSITILPVRHRYRSLRCRVRPPAPTPSFPCWRPCDKLFSRIGPTQHDTSLPSYHSPHDRPGGRIIMLTHPDSTR
jgi:hypothetical protein